jgi:hypothetical protein
MEDPAVSVFLTPPDLTSAGLLPARKTITIDSFREDQAGKRQAFDDLYSATRDVQIYRDNFNSEEMAVAEAYDRRNAAIFEATGTQLPNPLKQSRAATGGELGLGELGPLDFSKGTPQFDPVADWNTKVDELSRMYPAQMQLINPRPVREEAFRIAQDAERGADSAVADASALTTPQRFGAALGGSFAGMVRDPLQVATFFIGGSGGPAKTVLGRIAQAVMTEAAINSGVEAAVQVASNKWKREAGLDASVSTALTQVGLAGLFGGGIGGLVQGGREVFRAAGKAVPDELLTRAANGDADAIGEIADLAGVPLDAETRRVVSIAAEQQTLDRASFGAALDAGTDAERLAERTLAAIETDAPLPTEVLAPETVPVMGPDNFRFFDPAQLEVDAARFQFKAGGDDAGVTERLRGVGEWQPERAGVIVVFEDAGGRQFVADGHQRTGLAQRVSAGSGEKIELPGYVFRARDGFTAEDVRTIAALKNIAEGSGSSVDAAKVLRTGDAGDMNLPPNSALVRDAAGLARLSDDAFTMAVNELVDPKLAAVVGRMVPTEGLHAQILGVLKSEGAKTIGDAESMVRDLLSQPAFVERQDSLFGAEEVTRMLLKERAAVRASALNTLKKDKQVFAMLAEEENRVASAGNILDTATNTERAATDGLLIEIIEKLANRSGPVGDAFNAAAKAVAGGKSARASAGAFVDAVRAEIERAGGNLGAIGGRGADPDIIPASALAPSRPMEPATPEAAELADLALVEARGPTAAELEAEGQANMFVASEAGADGKEQSLIPGVEPVSDKARAELAASKPMRGGDAAAGGLFDADARAQTDLVDLIPAGTDGEGKPLYTTHADLVAEASRDNDLADLIASCKD